MQKQNKYFLVVGAPAHAFPLSAGPESSGGCGLSGSLGCKG